MNDEERGERTIQITFARAEGSLQSNALSFGRAASSQALDVLIFVRLPKSQKNGIGASRKKACCAYIRHSRA
jgi:hypothetical protein